MKPHHKRTAVVFIPLGLVILAASLFVMLMDWIPIWLAAPILIGGVATYMWGCGALARARGYSTALVITVVFGVVMPAVLLMVLPDKHDRYEKE